VWSILWPEIEDFSVICHCFSQNCSGHIILKSFSHIISHIPSIFILFSHISSIISIITSIYRATSNLRTFTDIYRATSNLRTFTDIYRNIRFNSKNTAFTLKITSFWSFLIIQREMWLNFFKTMLKQNAFLCNCLIKFKELCINLQSWPYSFKIHSFSSFTDPSIITLLSQETYPHLPKNWPLGQFLFAKIKVLPLISRKL
jgi:hypothetical protein